MSGVPKAIGCPGEVSEERGDVGLVVSIGVSLLLLQKTLQLLEGHVLLVLAIATELLPKLQDIHTQSGHTQTHYQDTLLCTIYYTIEFRTLSLGHTPIYNTVNIRFRTLSYRTLIWFRILQV